MIGRRGEARSRVIAGLVTALSTVVAARVEAAPPSRGAPTATPSASSAPKTPPAPAGKVPSSTTVPSAVPSSSTTSAPSSASSAPGVAPSSVPGTSTPSKVEPEVLSNEMRAEQLFRSGEKKFDSGQYAEACSDFAESLRFGPKLGTLLNLALCHETIGKVTTAWREFHHGAAWAAQNNQRERHDFALQHALALEPKLPRVLLQLPSEVAIASVEVDGEPVPESRWYLPLFLDTGEHVVAVTAPGKKRGTVTFRVANSPTEQLVIVSAPPDDPAVMPPQPRDRDPDRGRRTAGFVTLGVGAVGLVVGATFGVIALTKNGDANSHCSSDACDAEGVRLHRQVGDAVLVSTVGVLVGAAAGAVGGWLVLTSAKPSDKTGMRLSVSPLVGGASFGLGRAF